MAKKLNIIIALAVSTFAPSLVHSQVVNERIFGIDISCDHCRVLGSDYCEMLDETSRAIVVSCQSMLEHLVAGVETGNLTEIFPEPSQLIGYIVSTDANTETKTLALEKLLLSKEGRKVVSDNIELLVGAAEQELSQALALGNYPPTFANKLWKESGLNSWEFRSALSGRALEGQDVTLAEFDRFAKGVGAHISHSGTENRTEGKTRVAENAEKAAESDHSWARISAYFWLASGIALAFLLIIFRKFPRTTTESDLECLLKRFNLSLDASVSELTTRYRELAKSLHPDINREGSAESFSRLTADYRRARELLGSRSAFRSRSNHVSSV